ncbi:MAG: thioredoxin domain-containing protein [Elusimicrobia bacterium]|nr:thioredoxin domain-containing protein [Elusimicrobiota bacterium]
MKLQSANRLAGESSPYLLEHAHDPVDWYPWGAEAFAKSRQEDKPVFLSIGYSACHWCHVMQRESFADEEVALSLNEGFVAVKVDREERPDLDALYMAAVQAMGQQGGWPLSVWLTPALKPFMGGTYFPKAGFLALLSEAARLWKTRRADVLGDAGAVAGYLQDAARRVQPGVVAVDEVLERGARQLAQDFDPAHGGFSPAPKFPQASVIRFLLRRHLRTGEPEPLAMAERTLRAMARGGIYDQLGGGFHRYSTDAQWRVPHFEKMLYDNALLATAYLEAAQATGDGFYARIAQETLRYVMRDLGTPEGAFCAAQDADSDGEEGGFYVWTPEQVRGVLGRQDAESFRRAFAVEPRGASVLRVVEEGDFSRLRAALLRARGRRPRPRRDDKVLTGWNALMISALAKAAQVLGSDLYARAAARAARFLLDKHVSCGRLLRCPRAGVCGPDGYLEDHVYLAAALLDLYETTFDAAYCAAAARLAGRAVELFWDEETGGFFSAAPDGTLFARLREEYEGPMPLANAVMAQTLLRLHELTGDPELRERAERTVASFSGALARSPSGHASMLCAVDFLKGPVTALVVSGPEPEALLRAARKVFCPNQVVALADGRAPIALARGRGPLAGRAAAYVCRDLACLPPVTEPAELEALLRRPA